MNRYVRLLQHAKTAAVFSGENDSPAVDGNVGGNVVGDERDSVKVGVIQKRKHWGGGGNAYTRFREAANHGFRDFHLECHAANKQIK